MENKRGYYPISENKTAIADGFRAGIPIGLGYLAVSFSLGIIARNAGLSAFQSYLASFLCKASAGEYAGFTLIAAGATYLEMAIMTFVANARYLLMSCAMSQRLDPKAPGWLRGYYAFYITDEIFAVSVARPGYLNPWFTFGVSILAGPLWAGGTALGCIAGNLMPERLVSAFSVALYGMFLAVIIPAAKKSKVVAGLIAVCFAASYGAAHLPVIRDVSSGTRTIVLTVVLSVGVAILFPRPVDEESCQDACENAALEKNVRMEAGSAVEQDHTESAHEEV